MRAYEFTVEGLGSWAKNKLGRGSWTKPGDVVSGKTISNYLSSIDTTGGLGTDLERYDYQLKDIDYATARKYRRTTDKELGTSAVTPYSLGNVKNVSYDSLLEKPPVILVSGQVLDGNHRLERAIQAKLPRIPVLVQVNK
jgi:hypothetical protein